MAYAYDRSVEPGHDNVPNYTTSHSPELRDNSSRWDESAHTKTSRPNNMTTSSTDDGVSPELIERITERVRKEIVEHLKQTGNIEEQAKAQPMRRDSSTSSTSSHPTGRMTPPSPTQSTTRPAISPGSARRFSEREPRKKTLELSTIDLKWGTLFSSEGIPTKRLGQFLRGLANHMIEEYYPKKSIVVTPAKMVKYYTDYALENEPHPLLSIFRAQSNETISHLYRDLGCEHFLVQEDPKARPVIPALTPLGFAQWMTINILSYPEEESSRLERVVLAMPIDADGEDIDGKPERLPKQISRHLLPERADRESRDILKDAISDFLEDLGTANRRKAAVSPPLSRRSSTSQSRTRPVEIHQAKTLPKSSNVQPIERERKPYGTASDSSIEETIKIERERQPYSAQPGNGKVYTEKSNHKSSSTRKTSTSRTREQPEVRERRHRSQSTSTSAYVPPPRAGGSTRKSRRTSSPPIKSFSTSTPADIDLGTSSKYPPLSSSSSSFTSQGQPQSQQSQQNFNPGSYGSASSASNTFPPPPPHPIDIRNNPKRLSRDERPYSRRLTDEEGRLATGEFNSPRDAERWDRYQESTGRDAEHGSRGSAPVEPIDPASSSNRVPSEDWYRDSRDKNRTSGYYGTRGGY
ncbi:hypothetical protein LCER1_G002325 [Lachnellula cervina]|uniref:DUF7514 domain-containing protein n=1 Tax=Lachnellula cervina TaxID=1316786 RepID=A0A7D8UUQ8_9HELO|nr:hypothetical protein LCER1_G002325 [Lachnellula cervina]